MYMSVTGEGNGKPPQHSYFENSRDSMKRHRYDTERWTQYVSNMLLDKSGEIAPERMKRQSQRENNTQMWMWLVVKVVWCCKEYCIRTWNVKSMNKHKLEVVKQEMARVNINILGISELKWTGMGEFNSDDHYIYYCGQESLRRNGVAIMVNKRVWNAVLRDNLKMTEWFLFVSKVNHSISR